MTTEDSTNTTNQPNAKSYNNLNPISYY